MKTRLAMLCACLCLGASFANAADAPKTKPSKGAAMDPAAVQEMMMKAASPGPQHQWLQKLVGSWDLTVHYQMDPSQPMMETKSTSVITSLMDGRYIQEESTGEMMGQPFHGMGLTGYDNLTKKFVSTWMDNMGTGIMMSQGTVDAAGKVITYTGSMADLMTGKMMKYRMVTTVVDDDHHTFEMYNPSPQGKEMMTMKIDYARKM